MTQSETNRRPTRLSDRILWWVKTLLLAVFIYVFIEMANRLSVPGMIINGVLAGVVLLSILLRWGWLVPCTIWGLVFGVLFDPLSKGGTRESQMWETINYIGGGVFFGVLIGFMIDLVLCAASEDQESKE